MYANWDSNTYWGERCYANFNLTLVDDGDIFIGSHTMLGPNVTLVATGHPVRPDLRYRGAQYSCPIHIGENVWIDTFAPTHTLRPRATGMQYM